MPIYLTQHARDSAAACLSCLAQNYDDSPSTAWKYTSNLFDLRIGANGGHNITLCADCLAALRLALDAAR